MTCADVGVDSRMLQTAHFSCVQSNCFVIEPPKLFSPEDRSGVSSRRYYILSPHLVIPAVLKTLVPAPHKVNTHHNVVTCAWHVTEYTVSIGTEAASTVVRQAGGLWAKGGARRVEHATLDV